jgi:uncharacterized protein YjiS (DUF1127 family)
MSTLAHVRDLLSLPARLNEWLHQRNTVRLLASLDDRALADIGLTRADVEKAADRSGPRDRALATCGPCQ